MEKAHHDILFESSSGFHLLLGVKEGNVVMHRVACLAHLLWRIFHFSGQVPHKLIAGSMPQCGALLSLCLGSLTAGCRVIHGHGGQLGWFVSTAGAAGSALLFIFPLGNERLGVGAERGRVLQICTPPITNRWRARQN